MLVGVSKKTLIEDNELFIFEDDVEPLLSVLCGKTLEIARCEVLEEEELSEMSRQQAQFNNMMKIEMNDIKKMEEEEAARIQSHEVKKSLERTKRSLKISSHQKLVSRSMAKNFLGNLKKNTHSFMNDVGIYYNRFEEITLKVDVMPWILD